MRVRTALQQAVARAAMEEHVRVLKEFELVPEQIDPTVADLFAVIGALRGQPFVLYRIPPYNSYTAESCHGVFLTSRVHYTFRLQLKVECDEFRYLIPEFEPSGSGGEMAWTGLWRTLGGIDNFVGAIEHRLTD